MTTLTTERIEEIRKRLEAATKGPWHADTYTCYIWGPKGEMVADQDLANRKVAENAVARIRGAGAGLPMAANMDFIANAPRDISDLLSAYDALSSRDAMREALVKALAAWEYWVDKRFAENNEGDSFATLVEAMRNLAALSPAPRQKMEGMPKFRLDPNQDRDVQAAFDGYVKPKKCTDCGKNYADPPSKLCPGCQAYRDHTTNF